MNSIDSISRDGAWAVDMAALSGSASGSAALTKFAPHSEFICSAADTYVFEMNFVRSADAALYIFIVSLVQ